MSANKLPCELRAMIAAELDGKDITSFRLTCKKWNAVFADPVSPVWLASYIRRYDRPPGVQLSEMGAAVRARCRVVSRGVSRLPLARLWAPRGFVDGSSEAERDVMEVMVALVKGALLKLEERRLMSQLLTVTTESYAGVTNAPRRSKNLGLLYQLAKDLRFFEMTTPLLWSSMDRASPATETFCVLQLTLTHLRLCSEPAFAALSDYRRTQRVVFHAPLKYPLFDDWRRSERGRHINLTWLTHAVSYFKILFADEGHSTSDHFLVLPEHEKPGPWLGPLPQQNNLGGKFLGLYTSTDEDTLHAHREAMQERPNDSFIQDEYPFTERYGTGHDEDPWMRIDLSQTMPFDTKWWPPLFERQLQSFEHRKFRKLNTFLATTTFVPKKGLAFDASKHFVEMTKADSTIRNGFFHGYGSDTSEGFGQDKREDLWFYAGWVTPWTSQADVPGWARLTMVKYSLPFECEPTSDDLLEVIKCLDAANDDDTFPIFGFEGVVFPGGRTIVGRWWEFDETNPLAGIGVDLGTGYLDESFIYSGPFILWGVGKES